MATLSQLLGSFDNRKQVYDRLGSPFGAYTGNAQQNNWLLQNQSKWGQAGNASAPAAGDPFENLKNQALSSQILKEIRPYEEVNPFTNFFNEQLVRDTFTKLFQPEQQRLSDIASQNYNLGVSNTNRGFDQQIQTTNQNAANRGAFFGGVRGAQVGKVNEERGRSLGELLRTKEQDDFNRTREFNRQTEEQVQREKAFKNQQYLDEKNRYLTNPQYR